MHTRPSRWPSGVWRGARDARGACGGVLEDVEGQHGAGRRRRPGPAHAGTAQQTVQVQRRPCLSFRSPWSAPMCALVPVRRCTRLPPYLRRRADVGCGCQRVDADRLALWTPHPARGQARPRWGGWRTTGKQGHGQTLRAHGPAGREGARHRRVLQSKVLQLLLVHRLLGGHQGHRHRRGRACRRQRWRAQRRCCCRRVRVLHPHPVGDCARTRWLP
jgi:hypothetical protein